MVAGESKSAPAYDFLSGSSGTVTSWRANARDALMDLELAVRGVPLRLRRAARRSPPRRSVLVLGIEREDAPNVLAAAFAELRRSRHLVTTAGTVAGDRGKWENVNGLLAEHPPRAHDWVLIVDDDVSLPHGFLDRFLFLVERFGLRIAQPAHRRRSHAAWAVMRRASHAVVRETQFVEQGPLVAFARDAIVELCPFPQLRAGWGLDLHWSAIARERGWKLGVVDALPVRHGLREIASSYSIDAAIEEMREFLSTRPYVRRDEALRTLATHTGW
jgi:hypothetical protein